MENTTSVKFKNKSVSKQKITQYKVLPFSIIIKLSETKLKNRSKEYYTEKNCLEIEENCRGKIQRLRAMKGHTVDFFYCLQTLFAIKTNFFQRILNHKINLEKTEIEIASSKMIVEKGKSTQRALFKFLCTLSSGKIFVTIQKFHHFLDPRL